MRLVITSDLHFNHPRWGELCGPAIAQMNQSGAEGVAVVGDTAAADGDDLERCLELFDLPGPRLFVAGNHELWTKGPDSYDIYHRQLPGRLAKMGWHYLDQAPYVADQWAVVGNIGWYDYSFAPPALGIPQRFYQHKISPGAAARLDEFAHLRPQGEDVGQVARDTVARWNDGKFVKLGRSDEQFLQELLVNLRGQLESLAQVPRVVALIHHLPFRELLPPPHSAQWDFAKTYLGSAQIGTLLQEFANVREVFCGHSHLPLQRRVGRIDAASLGGGYRQKKWVLLDL